MPRVAVYESIPLLLAGLVFFFLGLDGIKASLKGLASRSMRRRANAAVSSPLRAAILGVTFGALSQSATAVSFLLAGLVSARLLPLQRALSMVAWANPGTAFFAFLAAINLNVATMWLIGLAGLGLRNRKLKSLNSVLGAILGIGFLLFGLMQLKRAAEPMQEADWFATVSIALNGSLVLGFIAGALLRVIIQSSSAIVVILIALCGKGVLGVEQAMMVIHGTGIGIGLSVILLGQGLRGEALRISYWQAILNACAATIAGRVDALRRHRSRAVATQTAFADSGQHRNRSRDRILAPDALLSARWMAAAKSIGADSCAIGTGGCGGRTCASSLPRRGCP